MSTPPATQPLTVSPVPLPQLYRHFLAYQNHLDRVAADLELQGKAGSGIRNHFQQKLNFTDAQFSVVRESASRLTAEMKEQDEKVKVLVNTLYGNAPIRISSKMEHLAVSPDLTQLQIDRDAIITREVNLLKAALGADGVTRLEELIQKDFAPGVTIRPITQMLSQSPDLHKILVKPSPLEARQ